MGRNLAKWWRMVGLLAVTLALAAVTGCGPKHVATPKSRPTASGETAEPSEPTEPTGTSTGRPTPRPGPGAAPGADLGDAR